MTIDCYLLLGAKSASCLELWLPVLVLCIFLCYCTALFRALGIGNGRMLWIDGEQLCSMVAIKEERVSAVFRHFLSTPWLSSIGGCCRQPLAPSASSFVVLPRYNCCTINYHPHAYNLQLAQSQDCANVAQSMDCANPCFVHDIDM